MCNTARPHYPEADGGVPQDRREGAVLDDNDTIHSATSGLAGGGGATDRAGSAMLKYFKTAAAPPCKGN